MDYGKGGTHMMCCKNCICEILPSFIEVLKKKGIARRDLNKSSKETTQSAYPVNSIQKCRLGKYFWE